MAHTINYRQFQSKAERLIVFYALEQVARDGLPGNHHFYITFDTKHPGVDMSAALRRRYPDEMTIVLQHWFEDLAVTPERFSVTLSFGNVPEAIVVPFAAMKTFIDPSVEYGLRFEPVEDPAELESEATHGAEAPAGKPQQHDAEVVSLDTFRKQ